MTVLVINSQTDLGKEFVADAKKKFQLILAEGDFSDARNLTPNLFGDAEAVVLFARGNGGIEDLIEFKNVEYAAKRDSIPKLVYVDTVEPNNSAPLVDYRENDLIGSELIDRAGVNTLAFGDNISSVVRCFSPLSKKIRGAAYKAVKAGLAGKKISLADRKVSVSAVSDVIKAISVILKSDERYFVNIACGEPVSYSTLYARAAKSAGHKPAHTVKSELPECTASTDRIRSAELFRLSATDTAVKTFIAEVAGK